MSFGLTPHQTDTLAFIASYQTSRGYSPNQREIAKALGTSVGNAHKVLCSLKERGHVDWLPGKARSITLTERKAAA